MAGDSVLAVLLGLFDLLVFAAGALDEGPGLPPWYVTVPVELAMILPLVFRRRSPLWSAYVVLVIGVVHATLELGISSIAGLAMSIYSVVVYAGRRPGLVYVGAVVAGSALMLALGPSDELVISALFLAFGIALCWTLGEFVGARRAYDVEVEARLHLLETERDQATRIAVAEERGRIARELHDVVAHAVSVMVVQADGASYAIQSNPELAQRALQTISETGRGALGELRRLLDVLRSDDADGEPRVPQPDAHALAELADRMRTAGVPVDLELGELGDLPAGVSLGVYRIVQESLTNTLKHAGRGATASVRVHRTGDLVEVLVSDDGAGAAQLVPAGRGDRRLPGGNGLIGMRERAHVYGGTLDVGPAPGGGWQVRAALPVRLDK
ncbi:MULTISPECIES: sensor histidine kinase [unclassified Amycolatopsis]|uniref:sensor histidine kinase n=1 Tax=unclassified Amycolatopsis TaxID=2618356 RepID=UPI002876372A|nr:MULTISPECIES: sensor histidine kinase [unclassified Amycolatopsis]MDS0133181.1 sensor histidine kinase [Amycolatopsis sp. 505]MDS0141994.1 sensor histidine kinase [Amycolatopsis sp. CM201R]